MRHVKEELIYSKYQKIFSQMMKIITAHNILFFFLVFACKIGLQKPQIWPKMAISLYIYVGHFSAMLLIVRQIKKSIQTFIFLSFGIMGFIVEL